MKTPLRHAKQAASTARSVHPSVWRTLATLFVVYAVPALLFLELADKVLEHDALSYDVAALHAVHGLARPWLDPLVIALTNVGGVVGTVLMTSVAGLTLLAKRQKRAFLLLFGGVGGAALLNLLLKSLFQRDRPQLWERLVTENSYSFPSGHAMASAALALSVIVICWPTRWRWWAVVAGVVYMVGIAFTRLYLGVHYPTDVIAGWLASGLWVALVAGYVTNWRRSGKA